MAATLAYTPVNVFIPVSTCVAFDACLFEKDEDLAALSNERVWFSEYVLPSNVTVAVSTFSPVVEAVGSFVTLEVTTASTTFVWLLSLAQTKVAVALVLSAFQVNVGCCQSCPNAFMAPVVSSWTVVYSGSAVSRMAVALKLASPYYVQVGSLVTVWVSVALKGTSLPHNRQVAIYWALLWSSFHFHVPVPASKACPSGLTGVVTSLKVT